MLGYCKTLDDEVTMAFKQVRKIIRYGKSSNGIVLPKEWLDYYNLVKGNELLILGNQVLVIAPKHLEEKARRIIEENSNSYNTLSHNKMQ